MRIKWRLYFVVGFVALGAFNICQFIDEKGARILAVLAIYACCLVCYGFGKQVGSRCLVLILALLTASPAMAEFPLVEVTGHHSMGYNDAQGFPPVIGWGFVISGAGARITEPLVGVVQRTVLQPFPFPGRTYLDWFYGFEDSDYSGTVHSFSISSVQYPYGLGSQSIYAGDFFTSGVYGSASLASEPIVLTSHFNGGPSLYGTGIRFTAVEFTIDQFTFPAPGERYEVDWTAVFCAVPEPSSVVLFGLCFGLFHIRAGTLRRRLG